jgi:iron complex transport system substrate-binding protein
MIINIVWAIGEIFYLLRGILSMKRKRLSGMISMLLAAVLALAGCGNSGSQPAAPPSKTTSAEAPAVQDITHAMGTTKVPANPQRIVVLDNGSLDHLLALGVKPVGAASVFEEEPFFRYLGDQTNGIEKIGTIDQPNLESIAKMKPDLIFGVKELHKDIYDKLTQIAPTVFVEEIGIHWKKNLMLEAEALGKKQEAEKLLNEFDNRVKEFQAKMGDKLKETHVSLLRPRVDHVRVYLRQSFSGMLIEEIGLPRPPAQTKDDFALQVTEEQMDTLDGDVILWFSRDSQNVINTKYKENKLWNQLKAVKQGNVYQVETDPWLSGMGIQAANIVLDDLHKYLVK